MEKSNKTNTHEIYLASQSPRRRELLKSIELDFVVKPSAVDEVIDYDAAPDALVMDLAGQKAEDVYNTLIKEKVQDFIVIGADTMVILNGRLMGKPIDNDDAKKMLSSLSGNTHSVFTGVRIIKSDNNGEKTVLNAVEQTLVTFRKLEESEIEAYIATREPMDKAGAYALQGIGSALVTRVEGCYTNVIGLPIPTVVSLLRDLGVCIIGLPACQVSLSK
jgi:septum formation protein